MAESTKHRKKKRTGVPFYVAVKSKNEVYYQMASLFQEATRGKGELSGKWMDWILRSRGVNNPGKKFVDNI
ncbi:MAG: hypothetical protein HUN04_05080 [Desulfobacter sp.]|nr:MAG: hypothetical protein HUN04_05080 [Desulfobacter sp.]